MNAKSTDYEVVILDYYNVLITPLHYGLMKYEWDCGLPQGTLFDILRRDDDKETQAHKLLTGKITLKEFCEAATLHMQDIAKTTNITLPENFSIEQVLTSCVQDLKINKEIIAAVVTLKKSGYKICILRNSWIAYAELGLAASKFRLYMKDLANYYFESTQVGLIRPSEEFYLYALEQMGITAKLAISIEGSEASAKIANSIGITTVIATENYVTLQKLGRILHINFLQSLNLYSCSERDTAHGYITTKDGVKIHYVEKGVGPVIILAHGFPDFWYGWRYQIPHLAAVGYRAIAIDHRGTGRSSCPEEVEKYSIDNMIEDIISLMDVLVIHHAVIIGHDLGGNVAWNCGLRYPHRFRAIISLNQPYIPVNPKMDPMQVIESEPGPFEHYLYFAQEGVAEADLSKDFRNTFQNIFTKVVTLDEKEYATARMSEADDACPPEEGSVATCFATCEELDYYVKSFRKTSFRPSLNRFRNSKRSWKWQVKVQGRKIHLPSLFLVGERDDLLTPEIHQDMKNSIVDLTTLRFHCGHWLQTECPFEVNEAITKWLHRIMPVSHNSSIFA